MFRTDPQVGLKLLCLLLPLLALHPRAAAQDVGEIAGKLKNVGDQRLTITGGINLGTNLYTASGIDPRRDNFQYSVRAGLNFSFLGIDAPFSFTFSDANKNFGLPSYTFAGISPRYKWATAHLGDRSLSFSKYTMGGISFRGGGLELTPGKWRIAGFAGKLNRALVSDLDAVGNLNGYYQRNGYGFKVGRSGKKGSYDLNFFSANDTETGVQVTDLGNALSPVNNKVVSLQGRQQVTKRVTLSGEAAHSVFNTDMRAPELREDETGVPDRLLGLFTPTESLLSGQALNLNAFYNADNYGLQAGYERITAGFRTLGSLFFNNDTENLTAGVNYRMLRNTMTVFLNGGLERTNLGRVDQESTSRVIGSVNVSYQPTDRWSFNAGYSNFRNDTKLRAQTEVLTPVDSIFLAQVTQSVNAMAVRQLGSERRPATLSLHLSHQRASSIINEVVMEDQQSRFTSAVANYNRGNADGTLNYGGGLIANFTRVGAFDTRTVAPTAHVVRTLLDNALSVYGRTALTLVAGGTSNTVWNLGAGANYRLRNGHRLGASANYLNRFGAELDRQNFSEVYGQLTYGYNFGGDIGLRRPNRTATEPN